LQKNRESIDMLAAAPLRSPPENDSDALSRLVRLLRFRATVFFSAGLAGEVRREPAGSAAHFYFVLEGQLTFSDPKTGATRRINAPGFAAIALANFQRDEASNADPFRLLCCDVSPIGTVSTALVRTLPTSLVIDLSANSVLAGLSELIALEVSQPRPGGDECIQSHLKVVITETVRLAMADGQFSPGLMPVLSDARLARAVAAFLDKPNGRWTVASMARAAGMSRSAFAATFANVAGTTPQQFISAVRFDLGSRLLAEGVPIKAVAVSVGYSSSSSFARSLRQARARWTRDEALPSDSASED
jgi:AraC-like DNA-binding protein